MTPLLADRLTHLPRLDRKNGRAGAISCKICQLPAPFFDMVDFNKCASFYPFGPSGIPVNYYRCDECGFLFTPFFDDWTATDFCNFVYNADYVLVDPEYESARAIMVAEHLAQLLRGHQSARILDYGAGGGRFAKRMEELGFPHVESYDPFSIPVKPSGRFDIITCIEVIEHIPSPMSAVRDMCSLLAKDGRIVLGETLQPADIGALRGNWWYVAPRNGHMSTFADRTLAAMAERLGLVFHRGSGHHVLRPPAAGPRDELADRFGPAMLVCRLYAPSSGLAPGFHGVELQPGGCFRWSSTNVITWHIFVPPGAQRMLQLWIPYLHESRDGFANACRIELAGRPLAFSVRDSAIVAEVGGVAPGTFKVTLQTPELQRPPNDSRMIGLAVAVG